MTPTEFEYVQKALQELEKPLELVTRIKIQRTMAQILNRSAERMEEAFVERVERKLYGTA